MSLNLNVISVDNSPPNQKMEYSFDESGGTIGRKLSNNWILVDKDRHLSGSHAKVEYDNGSFYIVDTSTNGVFIDGSSSPLGRGSRVKLNDGMCLAMGGYDIAVHLVSQKSGEPGAVKGLQQENDLFPDWEDEPIDHTDKVGSDFGQPIQKVSIKPKKVASKDPFDNLWDPSDDDNEPREVQDNNRQDNLPDLDSYYKPPKVKHSKKKDKPITPAETEVVPEKEVTEQDASIIPDNWGIEDSSSIDDLLSDIDDPFETVQESSAEPVDSIGNEQEETDLIDAQITDKKSIIEQDETADDFWLEEPELEEKNIPITHADIETASKKSHVNNKISSITAFLKGAGLDENLLPEETTEQHMLLVGKLFRTAIQGTMEVLRSRAEIKNEMRMDMTTIQPIQNNPIKFSVDANEALKRLLVPTSNSYMDPEQALNESYDDIKAHQVAVIAGVQASLVHVLKRFEPEKLIERLEEVSPISASIPIHRQAKLWNKFEDLYEAIEGEAEDDFNRLFGLEFAKAYDEQVATLKKQRSDF